MTNLEWYTAHHCDHAHCPHDCDHPQPFLLDDGRFVCGRCAILDNEFVEMVPCTPETCAPEGRDTRPQMPEYECQACHARFTIGDRRAAEPCGASACHPVLRVVQ